MVNDEETIYGAWRPIGRAIEVERMAPATFDDWALTTLRIRGAQMVPITIERRIERRAIWQFAGYEERVVES